MSQVDANHLLATVCALIPLLGGGVLLWQRSTAEGRKTAAWRALVDARLSQVEKRLENLDKLNDYVHDIRVTLSRYVDKSR